VDRRALAVVALDLALHAERLHARLDAQALQPAHERPRVVVVGMQRRPERLEDSQDSLEPPGRGADHAMA